MKKILCFSLLLIVYKITAQPTFNLSNLVSPNQTLKYERGILNQNSIEINGENLSWDFSEIEGGPFLQSSFTIRLAEINDIPQVPPFAEANRILVQEEDFSTFYSHIQANENGIKILSYVDEEFNVIPNQVPGFDLVFPVNVPSEYNTAFAYQVTYPSEMSGIDSFRVRTSGIFNVYIGGYGSLTLPNQNTYEVICLQKLISSIDTIESKVNGEWQFYETFSDFSEQLEFLSPEVGYYIARASYVEGEIPYYDVDYFTGEIIPTKVEQIHHQSLEIFPNPASDFVLINTKSTSPYRLDIYDMTGRLCHSEQLLPSVASQNINISALKDGVYIVSLQSERTVKTGKMVVKR
jgi:hypothetical protein